MKNPKDKNRDKDYHVREKAKRLPEELEMTFEDIDSLIRFMLRDGASYDRRTVEKIRKSAYSICKDKFPIIINLNSGKEIYEIFFNLIRELEIDENTYENVIEPLHRFTGKLIGQREASIPDITGYIAKLNLTNELINNAVGGVLNQKEIWEVQKTLGNPDIERLMEMSRASIMNEVWKVVPIRECRFRSIKPKLVEFVVKNDKRFKIFKTIIENEGITIEEMARSRCGYKRQPPCLGSKAKIETREGEYRGKILNETKRIRKIIPSLERKRLIEREGSGLSACCKLTEMGEMIKKAVLAKDTNPFYIYK